MLHKVRLLQCVKFSRIGKSLKMDPLLAKYYVCILHIYTLYKQDLVDLSCLLPMSCGVHIYEIFVLCSMTSICAWKKELNLV